jgi:hypothetical protein
MTLREVCQKYSLADSTLRDWIDSEVFGSRARIPRKRVRGRETLVFMPEHIEKLERFLRYREWFSALGDDERSQVASITGLLEQIEEGEYEGVIQVLTEVEQSLQDAASGLRMEIQRLYAKQQGDADINPEDVD